ncbi:translation initiation factor IF-2-like [Equus quagga]|uniref:translation initiation factor IF-2-like n=1 Tax=Equus quagga TaxID=89248 RepID=UPI001EE19064|nr:translation initiation factor IF-2-like [Equus quagga]
MASAWRRGAGPGNFRVPGAEPAGAGEGAEESAGARRPRTPGARRRARVRADTGRRGRRREARSRKGGRAGRSASLVRVHARRLTSASPRGFRGSRDPPTSRPRWRGTPGAAHSLIQGRRHHLGVGLALPAPAPPPRTRSFQPLANRWAASEEVPTPQTCGIQSGPTGRGSHASARARAPLSSSPAGAAQRAPGSSQGCAPGPAPSSDACALAAPSARERKATPPYVRARAGVTPAIGSVSSSQWPFLPCQSPSPGGLCPTIFWISRGAGL